MRTRFKYHGSFFPVQEICFARLCCRRRLKASVLECYLPLTALTQATLVHKRVGPDAFKSHGSSFRINVYFARLCGLRPLQACALYVNPLAGLETEWLRVHNFTDCFVGGLEELAG